MEIYGFHCLVYVLKQDANRYVDFRKMEIYVRPAHPHSAIAEETA